MTKEFNAKKAEEVLLVNDSVKLNKLLKRAEEGRELDLLLASILNVCRRSNFYRLDSLFLPAMQRHFATLSALSAHTQAMELSRMIEKGQSRGTAVELLKLLVISAHILNATNLREFVRRELVRLHAHFFTEHPPIAAVLALCVYSTLVMEACYSPNFGEDQLAALRQVWERVIGVEGSDTSVMLQLCSALFYTTIGDEEAARISVKRITHMKLLAGVEEEIQVGDYSSIEYTVMDFLCSNLSAVCNLFPPKKLRHVFKFLARACVNHSHVDALLQQYSTQMPDIRCSEKAQIVEAKLFNALQKRMGGETLERHLTVKEGRVQETWINPTIDDDIEVLEVEEEPTPSDEQLQAAVHALTQGASYSEMVKQCGSPTTAMKLLNTHVRKRKNPTLPFSQMIAELMFNEPGLKLQSLLLAAKVLQANHNHKEFPELSTFVSLCLGLCQPVAYRFSEELNVPLATLHAYMMAKAGFLMAAFRYASNTLKSQASVVCGTIPDFFQQINAYKEQEENFKAEQLEHSLTTVCNAIKAEKHCFHKFIPFVVSNSLTGEREITMPMFTLLSACDKHDLALLATNLPSKEKMKFSGVQSQFYSMNKIIG